MLKIDPGVRNKIKELANNSILTASYIKSEVYAFSMELITSFARIDHDSGQFSPNEATVTEIMKQHREQLCLDPLDKISVQKFVEQDAAAYPGRTVLRDRALAIRSLRH